VEFIDKAGGFHRAEQEMLPDVLKGQLHAQLLASGTALRSASCTRG